MLMNFSGNFAEWLSSAPQSLPTCINFLLSELSSASNPNIAAFSLVEVCSLCQNALANHCDEVLGLCVNALSTCPPTVKGRVFQCMSYVVKALPDQESSPRITFLVGGIIDQISNDAAVLEQQVILIYALY